MTTELTLTEVLDDAAVAAGVPGERAEDGSTTWSGAHGPFASLDARGTTASFRLDDELAEAARRTPDVSTSERGTGWVDLAPAVVDGPAADRASAWFAAAARRWG